MCICVCVCECICKYIGVGMGIGVRVDMHICVCLHISTLGEKNVCWTIFTIHFLLRIRTAKDEKIPFFQNGPKKICGQLSFGRQNFLGRGKKIGHR